jgi:hypothetical protein
MLVALRVQQAMYMLQTLICDLFGSTIFFHIISLTAQFLEEEEEGKRDVTANKMCVLIFFTILSEIFHSKN